MRVLIVDDDVNTRFTVERSLRKAGLDTTTATTVRQAMDRVRVEAMDAVLVDLRVGEGEGANFVPWLGSYSPTTKVVATGTEIPEDFRASYGAADHIRILQKPVETDTIVATLRELGPRRGFYGNAIEVELFDYVQMIALTGRDKLVEVETPQGRGLMWFEHGDLVHVEYLEYRGELAFYKLLAAGRGAFREVIGRPPPRVTVTRSSTHLLMEAARQSDEGLLGVAPGGAKKPSSRSRASRSDELDPEASFADLNEPDIAANTAPVPELEAPATGIRPPLIAVGERTNARHLKPLGDEFDEDFAAIDALVEDDEVEGTPAHGFELQAEAIASGDVVRPQPEAESSDVIITEPSLTESVDGPIASAPMPMGVDESSASMNSAGHAIFDDPDTRSGMLEQFWQFDGVNGVAIISSTGKVLAEDMRTNSSLVTLAGFYMRGAARIARTLGHNVFDGVVARSVHGQQMVMVSMGAASAVLSVEPGNDPEQVRDQVMGIE